MVALKEQATALGIAERVHFAGFLSEEALCKLYHDSHIFLHPSQLTEDHNQEGVPNSMLEAMATGLPVVATVHGGIPEAVTHEGSGFLVAERDVPALELRLRQLAGDEGVWRTMGGQASSEVRRFVLTFCQLPLPRKDTVGSVAIHPALAESCADFYGTLLLMSCIMSAKGFSFPCYQYQGVSCA